MGVLRAWSMIINVTGQRIKLLIQVSKTITSQNIGQQYENYNNQRMNGLYGSFSQFE